jgi:hypothetical protein
MCAAYTAIAFREREEETEAKTMVNEDMFRRNKIKWR